MQSRSNRPAPTRAAVAPLHRGPQALPQHSYGGPAVQHAPNAALLIDFDNVTMGIRSDLAGELRNLLGSDIIKGKVAVQRAYADWRRYPQYIVPLAESSIDMIMAPAYGSSKKNATDIRLSVDAMELVFTRPEIGTYILLSGDSDFASLVTKLKEYGKYVIGVGIRESSSDLLVMNCDEYYSYNALAGLVKSGDEEVRRWDPWELVTEAITRMQKNGDVMRSDRLKQVMQDLDATFDEKSVGSGYSKFSRFVSDAADKGLVKITKLENGQLEVSPPDGAPVAAASTEAARPASAPEAAREERGGRRRRGRGRDRDRDRERGPVPAAASAPAPSAPASPAPARPAAPAAPAAPVDPMGSEGERLTRAEAFELARNATAALVSGDDAALSSVVRRKAFELLGRNSESLSERNFHRILRDAHDAEVIDLRRRGDDYEVSLPAKAASVADQVKAAEAAATPKPAPTSAPTPRGMGPRGLPPRGRAGSAPPPELLLVGVVETKPSAAAATPAPSAPPAPAAKEKKPAAKKGKAEKKPKDEAAAAPAEPAARSRKPKAKAAKKAG
ncbi:MAG: NYN domain-containing protein [Gemmatimonadetes bacterium]|nr:NYN domain-containing protein [Gemmatimonadota bacterium]